MSNNAIQFINDLDKILENKSLDKQLNILNRTIELLGSDNK